MRLRPSDALILACLFAALGAMLLAFRGDVDVGARVFLVAFLADAVHGAFADPEHRLGRELDEVVELVAFSVAPGLFIYLTYEPMSPLGAAVLGAVPVVTGAYRLAAKTVVPAGAMRGLRRAWSALFAVAWCGSSLVETEAGRVAGMALLPLVALFNLGGWWFAPLFARPAS